MPGAHAARPGPGRARERATDLGREVLLTLAALFGAACVLVVVLVATMDLGVIVFRTGSMSPTIPTGGAAVVRTVPADQVEVGDVVTVPSPVGSLPVTHRVVHTETLDDGTTRLRLRGDANDAEDPFPYDVTEVRRVVASAPGVGFALQRLRDPWALAGVSVALSLLVSWALWPRERRPRGAPAGAGDRAAGPALPGTAGVTRSAGLLVAAAAAGALGLGSAAPAGAAPAPVAAPPAAPAPAPSPTTPPPGGFAPGGSGGDLLRLSSSLPLGGRWDLSPGSDLAWRVESTVRPPAGSPAAAGTLWVSLLAGGPLVERGGVDLVVQLCDTGWAADGVTCPGGAREVPATRDAGSAHVDRAEVGTVTSEGTRAVVVRLRVPPDLGDEYQGLTMTLGLRFDAFGEEVYLSDVLAAVDDEPGYTSDVLGVTGAALRPALWGAGAVLAGTSLAGWARRRRRGRRTEVRDAS